MRTRVELLVWIGVLGAPAAWAVEHVLGYGLTEATCDPAGRQFGVPFKTWIAILTSVTALVAVGALVASVLAFRAVRDSDPDTDPPPGRIWLMSVCGIVTSPLFLAIILLSGIGALVLGTCHQG